jgi:hypothetical protein
MSETAQVSSCLTARNLPMPPPGVLSEESSVTFAKQK